MPKDLSLQFQSLPHSNLGSPDSLLTRVFTQEPLRVPDFFLADIEVWTKNSTPQKTNLWIKDGVLKSLFARIPPGSPVVDCNGLVVLPAGVDVQAHLRIPGQREKELPESAFAAGVAGGYGAVLTMPNTKPVIDSDSILRESQDLVRSLEEQMEFRVLWSVAITEGQLGNKVCDFKKLKEAGARAVTDDGKGVARDQVMEEALRLLQGTNLPLLQHAEVPGHGGVLAPGPVQEKLGLKPYPDEAEWKMLERDLALLQKYPNNRYHVLHISSRRTLDLLRQAKERGLRVSGEVSPHHLFFNADQIRGQMKSFKMNPPIRSEEDRLALLQALQSGDIDFVATDHAPHEAEKKDLVDFEDSAFGTTGLETALRVLFYFYKKGQLTSQRLVQVFSSEPARFLGLDSSFGGFSTGQIFRGVIFDPNSEAKEIELSDLKSLSKNNCFLGSKLPGLRMATLLKDRVYFQ